MASLSDLRMQKHALSMRQMVAEIHLGKLNIAQAAAKFELTRRTVRHWIDLVEAEAETPDLPPAASSTPPRARRRVTRPVPQESEAVEALTAKIQALEAALEKANFKALYYTTLLRVAEEELGIDIEKKSVTKPSASC